MKQTNLFEQIPLTTLHHSWVYPTECISLATRAKGTALANVAFSVAGAIVNTIVPYLLAAVGFSICVVFAAVNFLMLVPIYLFYVGMYHLLC